MQTWTYGKQKYACPIALTANLLAGRWRTNVLWLIWKGTNRFNQLSRKLPEVNRGVLLRVLRDLERSGRLSREEHGKRPSPVVYALTDRALSLAPLLAEMARWGRTNADREGSEGEPQRP